MDYRLIEVKYSSDIQRCLKVQELQALTKKIIKDAENYLKEEKWKAN